MSLQVTYSKVKEENSKFEKQKLPSVSPKILVNGEY